MRLIFAFLFVIFSVPAHADGESRWNAHFQATSVTQLHPAFYSLLPDGPNSLTSSAENATSLTTTGFFGATLGKDTQIYVDPEITAGIGLSQTHGVAGFPNGEIYRVDSPAPRFNMARYYISQTVEFGGETEKISDAENQIAREVSLSRLTFWFGKFSLNDVFDDNAYAHDPRTQFFNWGFMDTLSWDYAADTQGYTYALFAELNQKIWAFRYAIAMMPTVANGPTLDTNIAQANASNFELEFRYQIFQKPGKVRGFFYVNNANMGNYAVAIAENVQVDQTCTYSTKTGFGLNIEQELTSDIGVFSRLGWDDGEAESFVFTEVDRTVSLGVLVKGTSWRREEDAFGLALLTNWISRDHAIYLGNGFDGFLLGDGWLHYAPEEILETYYAYRFNKYFTASLDYQFVQDPGYNSGRGPANILGLRLHVEL